MVAQLFVFGSLQISLYKYHMFILLCKQTLVLITKTTFTVDCWSESERINNQDVKFLSGAFDSSPKPKQEMFSVFSKVSNIFTRACLLIFVVMCVVVFLTIQNSFKNNTIWDHYLTILEKQQQLFAKLISKLKNINKHYFVLARAR